MNMRLLIGSRTQFHVYNWETFGTALAKFGVECRVVNNIDIVDGFPTKKVHRWGHVSTRRFNNLIRDFDPDVILTDGLRHFGTTSLKSGIPLIVHLSGDFWTEVQDAKRTRYSTFPRNLVIGRLERMGREILQGARIIMPVSKYLEGIVRGHLPDKPTYVLGNIMNPSVWHAERGMALTHPCVGLVQNATIWKKAKEMLVLKNVLEKLPDVTFYWVGDGPHAQKILSKLQMYRNFKWLGSLEYPHAVRQFLSEIDVFTLLTGLETWSFSVREAMMMKKPVIATRTGGIPEILDDGKSGLLVGAGDPDAVVEKISYLLDNPSKAEQLGMHGRRIAMENTNGDSIAREFVNYVKAELGVE